MNVAFPITQQVDHIAYVGEGRDERGNVIDRYADPVPVGVYGWHTSSTDEPQIVGHDRVTVDAQVLAPEEFRPSAKDRIDLPVHGIFEVIGETEDFNHGPFNWRPGNVVNLHRVRG